MNTHSIRVRDAIDVIRAAMAEATTAANDAAQARQGYKLNPALRGPQSAADAERQVVENATERIRQARAKGAAAFDKAGSELAAWRNAATPHPEAPDRAWMLRGASIIAAGGTIADVIGLAVARRDSDLLHGAHLNGPAAVVARLGGKWSDDAQRAIDAAVRSIEDAQAEHRLADPELIEQRVAARQTFALADEFAEATEYAAKVALGTARPGDGMRLGYRQSATERAEPEPSATERAEPEPSATERAEPEPVGA